LTNKRWIQKNTDINRELNPNDLPPNTIERYNDIIIVNIEPVKAVLIAESDPKNYKIWIYVDESFTKYDESYIGVEIDSWKECDEFINQFKSVVPLDEPTEEISYGIKFIHYQSRKQSSNFI
jgi:hypothetical protein